MGIYQAVVQGSQNGQTVNVSLGFSQAGADAQAAATDLANDVAAAWSSNMLPLLLDDYLCEQVMVTAPNTPTIGAVTQISDNGQRVGSPMPPFVVARVTLRTALRGRSYQGRWGIPGLADADTDNANGTLLEEQQRDILQGAVDGLYADMGAQGWNGAVISRYSGVDGNGRPIPRAVAIATPVTSHLVDRRLGSRVTRKA